MAPAQVAVFHVSKPAANGHASYREAPGRARSRPAPARPLGGTLKRVLDIVIATTTLVLASPVMLIVAILLKMSGGPVFFTHDRVGFGGRTFGCLKFRTMVQNPEQALQDHLAADPDARAEWQQTQKLRKDPRITLLGTMLRRSSIDELPQLLNIIRGDMSCVGPRPITPGELERYGEEVELYLQTRPGLTGLWQTSGRSRLSYSDRVELDCKYVRNWSIALDLVILYRTIFAVIRTDETS
ncbi:MAG: sugar transferase [Oricola sp.]